MRIPDRQTFIVYTRYYLLLSVAFLLVFGVTNYWASLRLTRFEFYLPVERHIPFVPQAILAYLSIFAVFVLPVFYIDKPRIIALSKAFIFTLFIAAASFIVFPAELAHERPTTVEFLPGLFKIFYLLELPHNLMPSLHIAFTVLFFGVCISLEPRRRVVQFYILWAGLLFLSVLLTRQHQLIDIPTGALLGWLAYQWIYKSSLR